ncbi:hypothetical protein GA0070216_101344 [Micromonospora matsumotoense]|uniref:Uncharacterized protein n=1 Tax=Micromonospora matsumotoense TaxID=121616 RepID=A0A1C4U9K3_9ACTN|nr:hypothetical protein [Micromonospora matsumotoense]SCE68341.1 hypothetical protein GA0070216_101344 [Micromonospora matsumotoense]
MNRTWLRGLRIAVATGLVGSAAIVLSPTAASAAACRTGTSTISGARLQYQICPEAVTTGLSYFLEDTAKDGRRAEVWLRTPSTSSSGVKLDEATRGAGDWAEDEWYGPFSSGVSLKVCTSDANTDRRCGSWL